MMPPAGCGPAASPPLRYFDPRPLAGTCRERTPRGLRPPQDQLKEEMADPAAMKGGRQKRPGASQGKVRGGREQPAATVQETGARDNPARSRCEGPIFPLALGSGRSQ
jgi:hypothetical protein